MNPDILLQRTQYTLQATTRVPRVAVWWDETKEASILLTLAQEIFAGHSLYAVKRAGISSLPKTVDIQVLTIEQDMDDEEVKCAYEPPSPSECASLDLKGIILPSHGNSNSRHRKFDNVERIWTFYLAEGEHIEIRPLLYWSELDVWHYIHREGLAVDSRFLAQNGYRLVRPGCERCEIRIPSSAKCLEELIAELASSDMLQATQEPDEAHIVSRLQDLGYL